MLFRAELRARLEEDNGVEPFALWDQGPRFRGGLACLLCRVFQDLGTRRALLRLLLALPAPPRVFTDYAQEFGPAGGYATSAPACEW